MREWGQIPRLGTLQDRTAAWLGARLEDAQGDPREQQKKRAPALRLVGLEARLFERDRGSDFQSCVTAGPWSEIVFREKRVLVLLRCPFGMIQTPPLSHPPDGLLDEIPAASRHWNGLNSPENKNFSTESKRIPVRHPFTFPIKQVAYPKRDPIGIFSTCLNAISYVGGRTTPIARDPSGCKQFL